MVRVVITSSPTSPGGHRLQGLRIEDLDQEMILVDVQAVALLALAGDARPHDLGEAVVVGGDDAESARRSPGAWPRTRARRRRGRNLQRQAVGVDPHLHHRVGHHQGIGGGADQGRGLEVLHDLDLPLGVAGEIGMTEAPIRSAP